MNGGPKGKWTPALQINSILLSIQALLSVPNVDDPLDETIARVWRENQVEAMKVAKEWTRKFASE